MLRTCQLHYICIKEAHGYQCVRSAIFSQACWSIKKDRMPADSGIVILFHVLLDRFLAHLKKSLLLFLHFLFILLSVCLFACFSLHRALETNKYNHITATYFLLAERILREKQEKEVQPRSSSPSNIKAHFRYS